MVIGHLLNIVPWLQTAMFGISCERFTSRLRRRLFECVVRQDIPWFELTYVSTGALTCLLSKDSALVQAMSGCKGSSLLHGVLGVIFSVAIVINIDPKLGLLTALFILVILAAIVFCMKVTYDVDIKVKLQDVVLTMNPTVSCDHCDRRTVATPRLRSWPWTRSPTSGRWP